SRSGQTSYLGRWTRCSRQPRGPRRLDDGSTRRAGLAAKPRAHRKVGRPERTHWRQAVPGIVLGNGAAIFVQRLGRGGVVKCVVRYARCLGCPPRESLSRLSDVGAVGLQGAPEGGDGVPGRPGEPNPKDDVHQGSAFFVGFVSPFSDGTPEESEVRSGGA